MKVAVAVTLLSTLNAFASSTAGIICRDDRRFASGSLRELILSPADSGYTLQSQFVQSLNSPGIEIDTWSEKLTCRIDEKSTLAFCKNQQGQTVVQIKERREVFFDSLEEDAKRKTTRYIDISLSENGVERKAISFAAGHCQPFGGEV